jgi:type III pantothenate kinase
MIIDVDIGNTRAKYRVIHDAPASGSEPTQLCAHIDLLSVLRAISFQDVTAVRIASVAAHNIADAIKRDLEQRSTIKVILVTSIAQCAGVTSSYAEPHRLGVDRWLAMLAAYNRWRSPCIVVDAGSALTFDVVDAAGAHQGGWIVPGLGLLRSALIAGTAGVRFEEDTPGSLSLGRSTAAAVHNGTLSMTVAWLNASLAAQLEKYKDARIVLCGGDADRVRSYLSFDALDWPDIVLDGLALIPLGD